MDEIERIRELDSEVFEELKEYFPKTFTSNFKKEFSTTMHLVTIFDTGATFIKNSIFDCCETDDYYGAKILYRSLIEHFIRFKFIFINWGKTKSDEFAKNYFECSVAREVIDLVKAMVAEQQLYDSNFKMKEWDEFLKNYPAFKKKTFKEIEDETRKYTFKNIIKFLNDEFNKGENEMSSFLGKLIIDYSRLSSFVHGGMKSYQEMALADSDEIRQKEYNRICGLTFQISNSIKLFTLLMYAQTDREAFTKHYLKLDEIMKRINN